MWEKVLFGDGDGVPLRETIPVAFETIPQGVVCDCPKNHIILSQGVDITINIQLHSCIHSLVDTLY